VLIAAFRERSGKLFQPGQRRGKAGNIARRVDTQRMGDARKAGGFWRRRIGVWDWCHNRGRCLGRCWGDCFFGLL